MRRDFEQKAGVKPSMSESSFLLRLRDGFVKTYTGPAVMGALFAQALEEKQFELAQVTREERDGEYRISPRNSLSMNEAELRQILSEALELAKQRSEAFVAESAIKSWQIGSLKKTPDGSWLVVVRMTNKQDASYDFPVEFTL